MLEGCGVVVPPEDPSALAKAIGGLLADPSRADDLGRQARQRCIAQYSFTSARATLFPLIEALASRSS